MCWWWRCVAQERADVVEEGGVLEQFALLRAEAMQARRAGGVEELECESRHLAGVRLVERRGARELQHAPLAHARAVRQLVLPGAGEVVEQEALAQAAVVEGHDRLDAEVLRERVEDGGAGDDDVGPRRREPRQGTPLVGGHRAQALRHRAQVLARERLVPCRHAVVEQARRHAGEVHDGARGAVGGGLGPAHVAQGVLRREAHVVLEGFVGVGAVPAVGVRLRTLAGQADGAQRDRLDDVGAAAVAHGDLGAAAADVDDQRAPVDVHAAEQAEVDEPGFLPAGDHVHLQPGRLAHEADEVLRVARLARRRRRDGHEAVGAVSAREVGEPRAHRRRALHRRGLQVPHVAELALAEADGLLLHAEHRPGVVGREAHDHEPRRVGADVDVGDRLGGDRRARRRRAGRRRRGGHVRPWPSSSPWPSSCRLLLAAFFLPPFLTASRSAFSFSRPTLRSPYSAM